MKIFKKLLPVAIGIGVIIVAAVVIVIVSVATNKTPVLSNGDENYLQYDKLTVTKQDLYESLKKDYGVSELVRLIDTYLYQNEIKDVKDEDLIPYIEKDIFGTEEEVKEMTDEKKQELWDEVIESLALTGVISASDAKNAPSYDDHSSAVWSKIKEYYRLQFAKEQWARKAYLEHYKSELKDPNVLFTDEEIEEYFDDNYGQTTTGLFIPFSSALAAQAMMESVGINYEASLSTDSSKQLAGWIKSSYDEKSNDAPSVNDYMTPSEIIEAFITMYNKMLAYTNNGLDIITEELYEKSYSEARTLQQVKLALDEAMEEYETIKGNLVLPTVGNINDSEEKVAIKWAAIDEENYKLTEDGKLTVVRGSSKITKTLTVTLELGEAKQTVEYKVAVAATTSSDKEQAEEKTVELASVNKDYEYSFNLNNDLANGHAQFIWEANDDSDFSAYLSASGTKLSIVDADKAFTKSYTVKPVSVGDYYFLFIKLEQTDEVELNDEIKAEIVEKMTEELYSANNLEKMYYENHKDNNLKIYDKFLEAIYEYNYNTFYGTTLGLKEYDELKESKKTKKSIVASVDGKEITADELFTVLEDKYGATYVKSYLDTYYIINSEFNTYLNPYKDIKDKDFVKSLLKSDIASFKQNFELDYFTYSYLSYYGFIPNFPASYGWKDFIHDYFNANSEEELLISKNYGGAIYTKVLEAYQDDLKAKGYGYEGLKKLMEESLKDAYSVDVMNLVISVDYNYDSEPDTKIVKSNEKDTSKENWTEEQIKLAEELSALVLTNYDDVLATGSISDKMNEVVKVYNEAAYEYAEDFVPQTTVEELQVKLAKFKKAGLSISFEKSAAYTNTSSLVEEFHEAMREIWTYANENGLVYDEDKALEDASYSNPIVDGLKYNVVNENGNYAFASSYGFHAVIVETAYEPVEIPTELEIKLYEASNEYSSLVEELTTANTNLESASGNEVAVSSYKAQIKRLEVELEEAKAELEKVIEEISKVEGYEDVKDGWDNEDEESDHDHEHAAPTYTLDEEISEKCKAWYDAALTEATSYIVEKEILTKLETELSKVTFASGFDKEQLEYYLDYLTESYSSDEE